MTINNYEQLPIPKYYQVYLSLKEKIENGMYPDETAIPSERQLVEMFGVSRITIIKAIDLLVQENLIDRRQGLGNFVCKENTRSPENILTVALVIPGTLEGYIPTVLTGLIREAALTATQIQLMGPQIGKKDDFFFDELCCGDVDGVIIYPAEKGWREWVRKVKESGVPLVLIDRYFPEIDCDYVVFNDEVTSYQLTRDMILHGMRRIAFLPQSEVSTTAVINRLKGFQRAHLELGLPLDEDMMWFDVYSHLNLGGDLLQDDFTQILNEHIQSYRPDGIFTINHPVSEKLYFDLMTLQNRHLMAQLTTRSEIKHAKASFQIGQTGIIDHEIYFKNPYYQRMAIQDGAALGREAFSLLLSRINKTEDRPQPIHLIIPMVLD